LQKNEEKISMTNGWWHGPSKKPKSAAKKSAAKRTAKKKAAKKTARKKK
jgi:hypothetical protein